MKHNDNWPKNVDYGEQEVTRLCGPELRKSVEIAFPEDFILNGPDFKTYSQYLYRKSPKLQKS